MKVRFPGRDGSPRGGFSLVEVLLVLSLTAVCMVVLGNILLSSTDTVDHMMVDTSTDQEMTKGITRLAEELATSSAAIVMVDNSGTHHDQLTFQTPGAYTGAANWGAVDASGVWNLDWTIKYQVIGGSLVRRVLDAGGAPSGADAVLIRQVDNLAGGTKGFRLIQNGPLIDIAVRIRKAFRNNSTYTKEFSSTVFLKNS